MTMLSQSDNELICRVGPDTPMGQLMREYWVPAMLSSELPGPDCDPVRVPLLGERFIAFRDSDGKVGLLRAQCPHRGASLFFGRNEESGLRCAYHGWKFDVTGRCLDMPNEPADSDFKDRVRARAAVVAERGGIVWAYLGTRPEPPALPDFEVLNEEYDDVRVVQPVYTDCNWLQTLEGDLDTSHFGFLHVGHIPPEVAPEGSWLRHMLTDRAPRYKVIDTEFGATYGAYRPAGNDDEFYWRIAHYLFPFYTMVPLGMLGGSPTFVARVPLDDHRTMHYFVMSAGPTNNNASSVLGINTDSFGEMLPNNTTNWFARFRPRQTLDNDYEIDREAQRSGRSYTGINAVTTQDRAVTEGMGPIIDRTAEHLGSADVMVIRVRRRLLRALRAFTGDGTVPPGVDTPAAYRQRSGGVVLPTDADWLASTRDLRAGTALPDMDPSLAAGV